MISMRLAMIDERAVLENDLRKDMAVENANQLRTLQNRCEKRDHDVQSNIDVQPPPDAVQLGPESTLLLMRDNCRRWAK